MKPLSQFVIAAIVGYSLTQLFGCVQHKAVAPDPSPIVQQAPLSRIEAFCEGMSTYAQAGAEFREAGKLEGELIMAAVEDLQSQGAPEPIIKAAVIVAIEAYREGLPPSVAKAKAYTGCVKALREA